VTRRPRPAALPFAAALLCVSGLLAACTGGDDVPPAGPATTASRDGDAGPTDETFRARAGAIMAPPAGDDVADCTAVNAFLDAVEHAPAGATVRIVTNSFHLLPVADALVAAHERGVHVQVLVDRRINRGDDAPDIVESALGHDRGAESFLYRVRGSARGGPEGALHQKTWMVSRTGRSRWVTMVGSLNLTYGCLDQYNDVYSFVDRRDVWRAVNRVFEQQVRDRPVADPARVVDLDGVRLFFYPGFSRDDDPVQRLLDRVVPGPGARLRIVQLAWSGERGLDLAQRVVALHDAGVRVEVVVSALGPLVERTLLDGGIEVRRSPFRNGDYVHHKLLLVSWRDDDGRVRRVISTGSDNLGDAPFGRDELVAHVDADRGPARRAWTTYGRHVDALLARARREGR
jgi:phosphatidylserine/phosphatidylglycerophosphate/cardiolipin synthase-like enzyme